MVGRSRCTTAQLLADRSKVDVPIDGAQQVIRWHPIVETKILEHRRRL